MLIRILDTVLIFLFFGTIPFVIRFKTGFNYYWDYIGSQFQDKTLENYDFIVVGAGSSGAIVANRLSKNNKVLLLEAGGDPLFYNFIPGLAPQLLHTPQFDWGYKSVPQELSNLGMVDKRSAWPRGKMLGGSSMLNYMVYSRGHPLDYDNWANITGDSTWKYENVLPFFKKSLKYNGDFSANEKHYGNSPYGQIGVENRHYRPLHQQWIDGGKELGYEEVDLNGPQTEGFGYQEVTQMHGRRSGVFTFIQEAMQRKNFHVARYAHAVKIQLNKYGRATGVWYMRHGIKRFARATKEIIVSGGTVGSAQLLMLSGIGPKDHLKSVGIRPIIDLPVGKNMKDHVGILLFPFITNQHDKSFIFERDFGIRDFLDYFIFGQGILTTPSAMHSHGFIQSPTSKKRSKQSWPDLQVYIYNLGVGATFHEDVFKYTNIDPLTFKKYLSSLVGKDAFAMLVNLGLVKSTGELLLKDNNPMTHPIINPKYFSDPQDLKILLEGVKILMRLAENTQTFRDLNATYSKVPISNCEAHEFQSSAYWECYVRHFSQTIFHHCGTCSMGKVVDSRLRVLRTKGLRVADASIMPDIVNGNTNAPCMMIGEKAADFIREYWSEQYLVTRLVDRFFGNELKTCVYSKLV